MHAITRRYFSGGGILVGVLVRQALAQTVSAGSTLISDVDIRKILTARIEALSAGQASIGIVAGVIGPEGRRIVSVGHRDKSDTRALTGDTAFEFGSVAKVFTALLLADMVVHHELSLADPVAQYLPGTPKLPQRSGRVITIGDLAAHLSGLPFMPNLPPKPDGTPYSKADLYNYLASYRLTRNPGSGWEYSNLGYWLLSEALATRGHANFEVLVRERILIPLKMEHSGFLVSSQMKTDLAIGHNSSLQPSPPLSELPIYSLMPAAGAGFYSTADDALAFLAAAMDYTRLPLAEAIAVSVNTRWPIPGSPNIQALGWTLIGHGRDQLVFRDGGTFGFASCLLWDRANRIGGVVLANVVSDVSDIGRHILRPAFPLAKQTPVAIHTEIFMDAAMLSRYAGRYEAQGEGIFTILLQGTYLTFEAPPDWGLPKLRMRPESKLNFFAYELPLRVRFQIRPDGSATGMTIFPPRGQKGIAARKTG